MVCDPCGFLDSPLQAVAELFVAMLSASVLLHIAKVVHSTAQVGLD